MPRASKIIYDFWVADADGKQVSLRKYSGQVVIVLNVASECSLANANFTQLKILQDKYYDQGLRVAAFPSNQFGKEPLSSIDVVKSVKEKYNYEPDVYGKIDVNGEKADPFFKWLKRERGGMLIDAIKWNFTKFLIDRKGHAVKRYSPTKEPQSFAEDIEKLLAENA